MTATPEIKLLPASIEDYPIVQNLARFYVYDRSGYMGWPCSEDGMFDCIDFKHYFEHSDEKAFLIKVDDELAGFVLLDKEDLIEPVDWNMGEFFVIAKFQGKGIATEVIQKVFQEHPGKWSIAVMPENIKAAKFWKKVISQASGGDYTEVFKTEDELRNEHNPDPYAMNIFHFKSANKFKSSSIELTIRPVVSTDINTLVFLSKEKRLSYEKAQPQFWRYAGESAEKYQSTWFIELISHKDYILLTAEDANQAILGFIIGRLMPAPEVYNPGGLTLMIDDFCVRSEHLWASVGDKLLKKIKQEAKGKGAAQILVVCGAHDKPKHRFLREQNLSIASEWFVGSVEF